MKSLAISIFSLWAASVATATSAVEERTLTLPCLMIKIDIRHQGMKWTCQVDPIDYNGRANHKLEIVGLTEADENTYGPFVSGSTYLSAPGAFIRGRFLDVTTAIEKTFTIDKDNNINTGAKMVGVRTVLAVRVISADGANPYNRTELIENVFNDTVNLVERYASCSYHQLTFEPFSGTINGVDIPEGLYEVTIPEATKAMNFLDVEPLVIEQLNIDLGDDFVDSIDHYMLFLPDNVGDFGAYAELPGQLSVYDGNLASFASAFFVHEIGHNLQLHHSSEGNQEYGDDTCSMGYGLNTDDFRVCFNPPKSWALGWYDDKHVTLNLPAGTTEERSLVGVAEYKDAGSNHDLFIRFVSRGQNYFIGFNRAVGINADQIEAVDQVTVTRSAGNDQLSFLLAKLSSNQTYVVANTNIEIKVLSIDVVSTPGVATVQVTNTATSGGTLCFSGQNLVSVLGKGDIRLDAVEIGDYVRRSSGLRNTVYTNVYGFLHWQPHRWAEFLKFTFHRENSMDLEVSPKHLLFSMGRTIPAGLVKVGDVLDGQDGETLLVMRIETVQREGVYAPATESGDMVVSGVRASNYVHLLDTSAIDHHVMSHGVLAPMRFICKFRFDWCQQQTYTKEGYSHWVKYFIWISDFLNRWGSAVQFLTTLLISPIVTMLTLCDQCSVQAFVVICCSGAALIGFHKNGISG